MRSEKGSFVRSPLGAFETLPPEPPQKLFRIILIDLNNYQFGAQTTDPCRLPLSSPGPDSLLTWNAQYFDGSNFTNPTRDEFIADFAGRLWRGQSSGLDVIVGGGIFCLGEESLFQTAVYQPADDLTATRAEIVARRDGSANTNYSMSYEGVTPPAYTLSELFLDLGPPP